MINFFYKCSSILIYKLKVFFLVLSCLLPTFSYSDNTSPVLPNIKSDSIANKSKKDNTKLIHDAVVAVLEKNTKTEPKKKKINITKIEAKKKEENNKKTELEKIDISNKYVFKSKKKVRKLGGWVVSDSVVLTGVKTPSFIRVGKGLYNINNKEWSSKKVEIKNNDILMLKHKSSLFNKGETSTYIYINNIKMFTFTSITE